MPDGATKGSMRSAILSILKKKTRPIFEWACTKSLRAAICSQGLLRIYQALENSVPDISAQYSSFSISSLYLQTNVRGMHAFQISLVEKAIEKTCASSTTLTVVDIGDSSGTHLRYIAKLHENIRALSVNIDAKAVRKIKEQGLEAIHARAEDLDSYNVHADLFLSFEMLEHLTDPIQFLHRLSAGSTCNAFVITVPYITKSRIGLNHLRSKTVPQKTITAETCHIFELSPTDWELVFRHAGWKVVYDEIYRQYPLVGVWCFMKPLWKLFDYEGFYGAILIRDDTWSKLYQDW